jgi:hypothetical protein
MFREETAEARGGGACVLFGLVLCETPVLPQGEDSKGGEDDHGKEDQKSPPPEDRSISGTSFRHGI